MHYFLHIIFTLSKFISPDYCKFSACLLICFFFHNLSYFIFLQLLHFTLLYFLFLHCLTFEQLVFSQLLIYFLILFFYFSMYVNSFVFLCPFSLLCTQMKWKIIFFKSYFCMFFLISFIIFTPVIISSPCYLLS